MSSFHVCSLIYCKIPEVKRNSAVVCSNPCPLSNLLNFRTLICFGTVMNYLFSGAINASSQFQLSHCIQFPLRPPLILCTTTMC